MKTAHQIAAEIAAKVAEHGTQKFMGNKPYTPNEFRAEIAERAILADRAQRDDTIALAGAEICAWIATPGDGFYEDDGTPSALVVQIDTFNREGRIRINLNDGQVWDGDPETDERPGRWFDPR